MLSLLFEFGNDLGVSLVLRREKRRLKINSDRTRIDTEARQKVSDANLYDGMRARRSEIICSSVPCVIRFDQASA